MAEPDGNSSIQTVNRVDDIREAESGQRVKRFEREAREEEEGSVTVSSWLSDLLDFPCR